MEKRTLLAIALSMVVMIGFIVIQNTLYPPSAQPAKPAERPQAERPADSSSQGQASGSPAVVPVPAYGTAQEAAPVSQTGTLELPGEAAPLQKIVIETNLLKVVLSSAGGDILSFMLKNHKDRGEPVEMILAGNADAQAFSLAFGNHDEIIANKGYFSKKKAQKDNSPKTLLLN